MRTIDAIVKERVSYDPITGEFRSLITGDVIGHNCGARIRINVQGKMYSAPKLAIWFTTGDYPDTKVLPIDGDYSNLRLGNLIVSDIPTSKGSSIVLLPSYEYLHECFELRGNVLYWKFRPRHHFSRDNEYIRVNAIFAGTPAGTASKDQYLKVHIQYIKYAVHRIVYKMVTNTEPPELLDHIDGDRQNNMFENLRAASRGVNSFNRKVQRNNITKVPGVCWCKAASAYVAYIGVGNDNIHLGCYDSVNEAAKARQQAELTYYGEVHDLR